MPAIGIGLIGTGFMGKAHAVALHAVAAAFDTSLRPVCEVICAGTLESAARGAAALGFARSTNDWRAVADDPRIGAIVIASPQTTHREIALAACAAGKAVFCEKPLGASLAEARAMTDAADTAGVPNMVGFNYVRTPATQLARQIIRNGEIGRVVHVRAAHSEDFLSDVATRASWRTRAVAGGALGDLAPHIINTLHRLIGPIDELIADMRIVHAERPTFPSSDEMEAVNSDDEVSMICHFADGATATVDVSRVATGRKMGYAYEITGTVGALRFDQEDQNSLWLYDARDRSDRRGFRQILMGPEHPDYAALNRATGHGTGYLEQVIIEQHDFLTAIETGKPVFPTFRDGLEVSRVTAAASRSARERRWVQLSEI